MHRTYVRFKILLWGNAVFTNGIICFILCACLDNRRLTLTVIFYNSEISYRLTNLTNSPSFFWSLNIRHLFVAQKNYISGKMPIRRKIIMEDVFAVQTILTTYRQRCETENCKGGIRAADMLLRKIQRSEKFDNIDEIMLSKMKARC